MHIVDEMQRYYQLRAPHYDTSMGYDDPRVVAGLAPVICRLQELLSGLSVLELACGPCFWTEQISTAARSIVATDFNETTLEMARGKRLDWQKVRLLVADAYDLSAVPGTFDGCLAVDWFAHVPLSRMGTFFHSLHDKLNPGAIVVFCDRLPRQDEPQTLWDEEGNHLQQRVLPDGTQHLVIKHFFNDAQYRQVLAEHGADLALDRFPFCRRIVVSYRRPEGATGMHL